MLGGMGSTIRLTESPAGADGQAVVRLPMLRRHSPDDLSCTNVHFGPVQWQYGPSVAPELSYWKPTLPQVCGSADAGTVAMTANARARASVILVIMVFNLGMCVHSADPGNIRGGVR